MKSIDHDDLEPYAPIPVSQAPSDLRIGSWFQKHQKAAQIISATGIATGLIYLTWRLLYTSTGIPLWSFTPLFVAELFGYFTYLIFVLEAWKIPKTPRLPPLVLACDIVIPTYNEDRDIVDHVEIGAAVGGAVPVVADVDLDLPRPEEGVGRGEGRD